MIAFVALGLSGGFDAGGVLAAGKGMVKIVTTPGDAKIFINGKRKGNSPAKPGQTFAIKLPEGEYLVEVVKEIDKFKEYRGKKKVFVSEDSLQTIDLELKRQFTKMGKEKDRAEKTAKKNAKSAKVARALKSITIGMVKIPGGTFRMGCVSGKSCRDDEKPVHRVTVSSFYMGKTEVTFDQWDACVADGGCTHYPNDKGWGRGNRPVINVSWNDAQIFIKWLNKTTGKRYRLPSEAEWEYAARAGANTIYPWGNEFVQKRLNCGKKTCGDKWKYTAPVGSFAPNNWGIHDMQGNVWEWVEDCSWNTYKDAPTDGSANTSEGCSWRMSRGGSWVSDLTEVRSAARGGGRADVRDNSFGFRMARSLP